MKRLTMTVAAIALSAGGAFAQTATDENNMEQAETNMEQAGENIEQAAENTGEAIENSAENAGQEIEQATDEAGQEIEQATDEAGQEIQNAANEANQELDQAAAETGQTMEEIFGMDEDGLIRSRDITGGAVYAVNEDAAMGEAEVPPRTTVILVHAVNPFGFAWCRRVDEQNVDLNRNFVDLDVGEEYTGRPPRYELVHKLMNPTGPSSMFSSVVPFRIRAGLAIKRYGVQALSTAIASGQYAHPRAMFFGGVEPSRSTRFMQERFWLWTRGAGDVVHLDLHTGLGPYADYQLFIEPPCLPHLLWFRKYFDQHRVVSVGDRGVYAARGVMGAWLARHAEGCRYRFACAEFGTYQTIRVLAALRAENRAHHYAPSRSPVQMRAKRELVECFCPRNKYWRQKSVKRGVKVIEQALSAVQYVA